MPQPIGRDIDDTRIKLTRWLEQRLPEAKELAVENLRGPGTTGFSSDTLMFDLHWRQAGEPTSREGVLRLEPTDDFQLFPEYDVGLQFDVMEAMAKTKVPVPEMLWIERDAALMGAPFYVMERLDGQVPSDSPPYHTAGWIFDATPEQREKLWLGGIDAMAEVHKLDWRSPEFACVPQPPKGTPPLQAQLQYWDRFVGWGMGRENHPLLDQALDWLRANAPEDDQVGICWGDARISNQIFRDFEPIAVIDWEMVFIGNPVADIAWYISLDRCFTEGLGLPRLEGMPDQATSIAHWEQRSGLSSEHFAYYNVFAGLRFAAIMARLFLRMKHYEVMPQEATADRDNLATNVLKLVLAEAGA
jgi:aminoglycoside phosphotransferase (APT) family kinase protein